MPKDPHRVLEGDALDVPCAKAQWLSMSGVCAAPLPKVELLVPDLWPGESAKVRVLGKTRQRAFGKILSLETGHPKRLPVSCAHHPNAAPRVSCGGCPWMSLSLGEQRKLKAQILSKQMGLEIPELIGDDQGYGYRLAAKRVCARVGKQLALGSFAPRSHDLAFMDGCRVDHPSITQAFALAKELLNKHEVTPYDEASQSGELRYLWAKSNQRQVHLTAIGATDPSSNLSAALEELLAALSPGSAVSWHKQDSAGNAMRAEGPVRRIGPAAPLPTLELLGQSFELDALGFLQPNPALAQRCYRQLVGLDDAAPPSGELALDLYAGLGVTSQALSTRFKRVLACEQRPPEGALPMVTKQSAEDFLADILAKEPAAPELVIANPPRAGMSAKVCERLIKLSPRQISIMSCGPVGLAKNLAQLRAAGYGLAKLLAFDTLPHTAHVELVAQLQKS